MILKYGTHRVNFENVTYHVVEGNNIFVYLIGVGNNPPLIFWYHSNSQAQNAVKLIDNNYEHHTGTLDISHEVVVL